MDYMKPLPRPSRETQPFWEAARAHRLMLPRCAACGHWHFPPTQRCPECGSASLAWTEASGRGRVYSFVIFHRVYHPGFAGEVPYAVAVVELAEGPRLVSNIIGIAPEAIRCDMPVEILFEDVTPESTLPKFRPAPGATES